MLYILSTFHLLLTNCMFSDADSATLLERDIFVEQDRHTFFQLELTMNGNYFPLSKSPSLDNSSKSSNKCHGSQRRQGRREP